VRPLLACLLLLVPLAAADTVTLKGGKKLHGLVVAEEPEVVVNPYNSPVPGMTFGVERVPKDKVKKIERTLPEPQHEFQRRLLEIERSAGGGGEEAGDGWGDEGPAAAPASPAAARLLELATWCEERKLKEERAWALELALRHDPANETARKLLGAKAPAGSWPEQMKLARAYLAAEDAAGREEALGAIAKSKGFPFDELYLQRAWRSRRQPTGYQENRAVTLRADKLADNARYALLVPRSYDPLRPTPLVIGLHGGGAGGADGKLVVGSGPDAMPFYQGPCEARGWLCACPTAVQAGWRGPNDDLIDAILEELCALYNVDENRIYLVGHSMGGGGTWAQGARLPETWAAIAPAASYGPHGFSDLEKTRTGLYVYHSDDDPRCNIAGVRPYMEKLPGSGMDFVYTELSGQGHSFPSEVIADIFRFFDMRLLARRSGRFKPQVRPLSSFERKVSRDEKKYLPSLEPEDTDEGGAALKALLKELKTGGGVSEQAVAKLVALDDPRTDAAVGKVLLHASSGPDVRRYAARVLGERKAKDQVKTLTRVLLVEEEANALLEILAALEQIGDPGAGPDLLRFLKKRGDYLEQRTQGSVLSHSDWETIVPTLARACALVGTYKPDKAAATIASVVLEGVLLSNRRIRFDVPNQHPQPYAEELARAACTALQAIGGTDAVPALEKMRKVGEGASGPLVTQVYGPVHDITGWAREPRVAGHVREALAALSG